ncbi:MurR/RpiR family transcriptional regulator [Paenibacillus contaminans]|uniref:MurR/RpiR family transcriptional regulator n=1 Tax=Paenibacillus contaminans TaxID=450362 RepID=A0A329MLA6_9BACL|nr:MurR/RpiR family transcriptional regulator [Paenibacillus contaminans]RAV20086.1 MurR/RpiR family transcriptional regulator [Paenibacillus contaminans]
METIRSHIRKAFDSLTASQRKVAKFILEDPSRIALLSAKEVGAFTGTSETTVIRFSVVIGFTGYGMLQKEIHNALLEERKSSNPISRLGTTAASDPTDAAAYIAHRTSLNAANVERTLAELSPAALEQAVELIRSASHIAVIGLRASFAPAHWLTYSLNILRGNATLYHGGMEDGNYMLSRIQPGWLVIAISFPRYMRETHEFVKEAKRRSAQVIAITDDALSPLALLADQLLKVEIESGQPVTLQGMPAVFALLNTLTGFLTVRDHRQVQQRLDQEQALGERSFYFVNPIDEG